MSLRVQVCDDDLGPVPSTPIMPSCASGPPSVAQTEAGSIRGRLGSTNSGSPDLLHATPRRDSDASTRPLHFYVTSGAAVPPAIMAPHAATLRPAMSGAVDVGSMDHSPLAVPPGPLAFVRSMPWSNFESGSRSAGGAPLSHSPFGTGGIQTRTTTEHPDVVKARLLLERFAAVSQAVATPPAARALTSVLLRQHAAGTAQHGDDGEEDFCPPASDGASTKAGASSTVAPSRRSSIVLEGPSSRLHSPVQAASQPLPPGAASPSRDTPPHTSLAAAAVPPPNTLKIPPQEKPEAQPGVNPGYAVPSGRTAPRSAPRPRRATIWATAVEVDGDADVPQWLDMTPASYRAGVAAACVHALTLIICGVACAFAMPRSAALPKAIVDVGPDCDPRVGTALSWLAGLLLPVGAMVFGWVLFVDLFVFPLLRSDAANFSLFRICGGKKKKAGTRHEGGTLPASHFDVGSDGEVDGELGANAVDMLPHEAPATPMMPNAAATSDPTVSMDDAPPVAVPTVRSATPEAPAVAGCVGRKSHDSSLVAVMTPGSGLVVGPGGILATASRLGRRDLRTPVVTGLRGPVGHPERALRATQHLRHYTLFVLSTGFLALLLLASAGSALYVWIAATAAWQSEPCGRSYDTLRGTSAVVVVEAVAIVLTHIVLRTARFCRTACVSAPPLADVVARR